MEKSYFDTMYGASDQTKEDLKKPLVKKRLERKLQSAYDDAGERIIEAEKEKADAREDFVNYDINAILSAQSIIDRAEELQKQIKEEYKFLFGLDMVV